MLTRVDRVQLATPDRARAAEGWIDLLGAEHDHDDRVDALGARRSRYRLGNGWVEFVEPDGAGPVADALAHRPGGLLFAGGVATPDVDALAARLKEHGVDPPREGDQMFLDPTGTGGHGLRLVVSADDPQPSAGAIDQFYEITNLVHDSDACMRHYAALFGLDPASFSPITSDEFGYAGILTLFDPERLDRLEVITPHAPATTMGRFFAKAGEALYMCFAETGDLAGIEARALDAGAPHTRVPPSGTRPGGADTVFLHPGALGGMMLGLSRRSKAWVWSGRPERVEPVEQEGGR
jgi:hypothetical protein